MPAPTIPAGSKRVEEDLQQSWKEPEISLSSELVQLPEERLLVLEQEMAWLRKQLESELKHVTARLQVVEARLDPGNHNFKAAPTDDTNVVPDYGLPLETLTLSLEVPDAHQSGMDEAASSRKSSRSRTSRKAQEFTEVWFEESAWSIPLLAGLVNLGVFDTLFASALVFLNLGMQSAFSIILLTPAFMGEEFESKIQSAKAWRTSVAHDERYMDLAGTSLVTRVCKGDGSVILSTVQATLVEHVNSFLGMEKDGFDLPAFQPGILLCMLCIVLWALCVYKEFRRIWVQLEAAAEIPKARSTSFFENTFETISWGRFCLLLLTYACRTAIASVLLVAGILWLARTTSISELMLNAVALNAILDVDEFLFVGMTPIKIQHAIQSLEPMKVKYSRRRSECESIVHFISLVALVSCTYLFQLGPLTEAMLSLKNELCGGNQAFVVGFNPETQLTHALNTPGGLDIGRNLTISELAVESHKATSPETTPGEFPTYLLYSTDKNTFSNDNTRSIEHESGMIPFCIETEILSPAGRYHNDTALIPWTAVLIRNSAASVGLHDARRCVGCVTAWRAACCEWYAAKHADAQIHTAVLGTRWQLKDVLQHVYSMPRRV